MKINKIILSLVLLMLPLFAGAQALKGSYFLDNSINGHKLNPAFAPRANYFQLVGLGGFETGLYSNLDMRLLTYPVDGKLGTFLHPSVSIEQFDKALPEHLNLDMAADMTILSIGGFNKKKAFWNFTIDARVMADVDLPSDLLMFLKKGVGTQSQKYNIGNLNAYGTAALQASFGYNREYLEGLRVGWKVRAIAPVAYAGLNLEDVSLTTGKDKWTVNANGNLYTAMQGLDVSFAEDGSFNGGFDRDRFLANKALAGFGYSVDLGVEYTLEVGCPVDGLAVSFAVTDLGQIFYTQNALSAYKNTGSMDWVGFHVDEGGNINIEEAMEDLKANAASLLNLEKVGFSKRMTRSTMPRIHAGVELPFLKRSMSVGLLYSARFSHSYARHELTASYNLTPCKWFAMGLNYSFLNTITSMGAIMEFTPKVGPCLFVGMDYIPVEMAKLTILESMIEDEEMAQLASMVSIPTSTRFNLCFGMSFNLGSKHVNSRGER